MKKAIRSNTAGIGRGESQFISDVYNSLADVAYKYQDYLGDISQMQDAFETAFEWFTIHFFDDGQYEDILEY